MRHPVRLGILGLATAALATWGCGTFEDLTPENAFLRISGSTGAQVQVIYSSQFVAGVTELGVTEVSLFLADTVVQTLPVDTVVNISIARRFFVEVVPVELDKVTVQVQVDVDDRPQLDESGDIFLGQPWRFVYLFNEVTTRIVDVVL